MRRILGLVFLCLFATSVFAVTPLDNNLSSVLQGVMPAVVNIRAKIKVTDFNTLQELQKRAGKSGNSDQPVPDTFMPIASGVMVDAKNGYILTNAHVINDAQTVTVTLSDGRHFTAKVIGADKPSDVAVLQIKAKNLTAMAFADSNQLKVGDAVAAIGNPFGLNQTATSGIVSALGRTTLGIETYENFIQTDAPINPGNSGGALINSQGQLIGINTAILAPDRGSIGIGFAIPSNMAKSVMTQLLQYGNVKRGMLGIGAQDMSPELASAFNIPSANGAAVTMIWPDSPAQQAGLQVGDIITAVNGSNVKNASDVVNTVGFLRVDSKVKVDVLRNNKQVSFNVSLSDPSKRKEAQEKSDPFFYGVALKNFTLLSPIHGNVQGVLVVNVDEESNAWNSDLRAGDVITSVKTLTGDIQKVTSIQELKAASSKAGKSLMLNVLRGVSAIFLVLNTEQ